VAEERTGRAAFLVAVGILSSRVLGLFRSAVFAHFFGVSAAGDAFNVAFRIPNMLQNLFGEGVLSASFIPEYAGLRARNDSEHARELAGAVAGGLGLVAATAVLLGVLGAPWLVRVIAPGFTGDKYELTVELTRVLFPGAALLVLSAWCLGILNSHRKFLLSYTAPVAWNVAMIATLLIFGPGRGAPRLAVYLAWGSVIGSAAQFLVQVPSVIRYAGAVRPNFHFRAAAARRVFSNFGPVFVGRGVVQISGFVDLLLASFLPGAVTALTYAQTLYMLPGSLFGQAVAAAELPAMASALGTEAEVAAVLRARLNAGMARIAFFVLPCVVAFLFLGGVIAAALFQTGRFHGSDATWVWQILGGSTIGLLASTLGRLDSSTYYALRDTRTPLKFAIMRIALTTVLGYVSLLYVPRWLGIDPRWGVAGLTASAGIAGWLEFVLLRRGLTRRIGRTGLSAAYVLRLWAAALPAVGIAELVRLVVGGLPSSIAGVVILGTYGVAYLVIARLLRIPGAIELTERLERRFVRRGRSVEAV
jgi:putative peptidoglycan lipid II flippase